MAFSRKARIGARAAFVARFQEELRAGDGLHILTTAAERSAERLRFEHKLVNSMSGAVATTVEETLSPRVPGAVPDEAIAAQAGEGFMVGSLDVVRAAEVDEHGELSLGGYVHRSSAASAQLLGAAGITPEYLRSNQRGFATFEIRLELREPRPRAGARLKVESALARLGSSSLQMLHRMCELPSGRLVASGSQSGAHFDLATRRSTPIPQELRERAAAYRLRTASPLEGEAGPQGRVKGLTAGRPETTGSERCLHHPSPSRAARRSLAQ